MSNLAATLRLDLRLQARSQLYAIGIVVAILFGVAGRLLVAPEAAGTVLAVVYLTGIGGTTFMMSASLLLLEKSVGTLQALRTSPLTSTDYIGSKVITLTAFATIESGIIYLVGFTSAPVNPALLLMGVVLLGALYTLVGLGLATSHDSVTGFLFPSAAFLILIFQMPAVFAFAPEFALSWAIPTHGAFLFMLGAGAPQSGGAWIYAMIAAPAFIVVAFVWAKARFAKFIGLQER